MDAYEERDVGDHPLFLDLAARPVDLGALWLLVANLREGISGHFVRWLAGTIERLDDARMASLLAKQLNDELGNGDPERIHALLLDQFIDGLDPWRPRAAAEGALLRPGRTLARTGARPFYTREPFEAIGALMVGEIFAKKMDRCLGDEIRRQALVPRPALTWLVLHETLEVDHADDASALAALFPPGQAPIDAAWRGARAQWDALWDFLTGVHQVADAVRVHGP